MDLSESEAYWENVEESFDVKWRSVTEQRDSQWKQIKLILDTFEEILESASNDDNYPEAKSYPNISIISTLVANMIACRIEPEYIWKWVYKIAIKYSEDEGLTGALIIGIIEPATQIPVDTIDLVSYMKFLTNKEAAMILFSAYDRAGFPENMDGFPENILFDYFNYKRGEIAWNKTPIPNSFPFGWLQEYWDKYHIE